MDSFAAPGPGDTSPQRAHRRWPLVLTMAALLVFFAGAALVAPGGMSWDDLRAWTERQNAAYAARDCTRPVLWGQAEAGRAVDHYREAMRLAQPLLGDQDLLFKVWQAHRTGGPAVDAEQERIVRARWAPAVQAMHRGARCGDGDPGVDVRLGFSAHCWNLLTARWIANLAVLDAADALDAGDDTAAVHGILDVVQWGSDLAASPLLIDVHIGFAVVGIGIVDGVRADFLARLGPEARAELAEGLQRLEAGISACATNGGELLLFANWLVNYPQLLEATLPRSSTWRYGFSRTTCALEAFAIYRDFLAAIDRAPRGSWPARQATLAGLVAGLPKHNPLLTMIVGPPESTESTQRRTLAQVRLLRLALAEFCGAPLPALDDPFGSGPLQRHETPADVTFASVGTGSWTKGLQRVVPRR